MNIADGKKLKRNDIVKIVKNDTFPEVSNKKFKVLKIDNSFGIWNVEILVNSYPYSIPLKYVRKI